MDVGQRYVGTAEILRVSNKPLQCGKRLRRCLQTPLNLREIRWPPKERSKDAMRKYLTHQWPVKVAINDGEELAAAGAIARVRGLETRTRECLVDVTRDRAGLVDLKVVVNECRHAFEGVKRQIDFRDIGSEGIDLDPVVVPSLFFECETSNPTVNTLSVTV